MFKVIREVVILMSPSSSFNAPWLNPIRVFSILMFSRYQGYQESRCTDSIRPLIMHFFACDSDCPWLPRRKLGNKIGYEIIVWALRCNQTWVFRSCRYHLWG
jgi:hypothetical protein